MLHLNEYTFLRPTPSSPEVGLKVIGVGEVDEAGDLAATYLSHMQGQSPQNAITALF